MANIFDTPTKQTYVDTYVPLPFQAIAAIGDKIEKQNADTEAGMSQLEGEIAKQKVTDQLLTGTNRSVKTGQTEFKNNLLKDIRTEFNDLSEQQASGKIDSNAFNQRYNKIKKSFVERYELLKKYSSDAGQIEKQNELIRQDKNATGESSILNKVYDENKRYIKDMNTIGYSGAPIYNFVNEMDAINQTASGFSPQDIRSFNYVDNAGIRHIGRDSGVTKARIESLVDNSYNGLGIAQQHRNRVERDIDDGKYLDLEGNAITFNAPIKVTRIINGVKKEIETTFGENEIFKSKENFKAAVVQKAVSNHLTENIIEDPATKAKKEADIKAQEERAKGVNVWSLFAKDADPNNSVDVAYRKANPNGAFSVDDQGNLVDLKSDDLSEKVIYRVKSGKNSISSALTVTDKIIFDPQNPPAGWKFEKGSFWHPEGKFIGSGGYELDAAQMKREVVKSFDSKRYNSQVQEVFQWAAATGQITNAPGSKEYPTLLEKYKIAIKNGALNVAYIPQFDAKTADDFNKELLPKTNDKGEITNPGRIGGWVVDGVKSEDNAKVLANGRVVGLDMTKGGNNVLIQCLDGQQRSVNMNSPTLKSTFNPLSDFIKANNQLKLNPLPQGLENIKKRKEFVSFVNNKSIDDVNKTYFSNQTMTDQERIANNNSFMTVKASFASKGSELEKSGYIPSTNYTDPKTGTVAISYINHKISGGQNVIVLKFHPGVDSDVEILSEAAFNREVQQKAFGEFAAGLDPSAVNTKAAFLENQTIPTTPKTK